MLIVVFFCCFFFFKKMVFEPVHDKTYNKTCVISKDSDQPVHPPSMARVLFYIFFDSLGAVGHLESAKIDQTVQMCRR